MARVATEARRAEMALRAKHEAANAAGTADEAARQAALRAHVAQLPGESMQDPSHAEQRARMASGLAPEPEASRVARDKQKKPENLDGLKLADLKALAEAKGLDVSRADGKPGKPRRSDYLAALS